MYVSNKPRTVVIDVDETIIIWSPEKIPHVPDDLIVLSDENHSWSVLPHNKNIDFLKKLYLQGYFIVVWSAGGVDWANKIVEKLNLTPFVDLVMSKPEFAVDDLKKANQIIPKILFIDPITGNIERYFE